METGAKLAGAVAIPFGSALLVHVYPFFCFYVVVAAPLFSIAIAVTCSEHKLTIADGLWHVPDIYALFTVLGLTSYAGGSLLASSCLIGSD